jgi:hypothetical protein
MSMTYGRDALLRKIMLRAGRPLPNRWRKPYARGVRGWLEAREVARANAVVLSHAKSGRTWLATMLAAYERAAGTSLGVFFSHDNYIRDWAAAGARPWHAGKRVVLLVREPGDVLVSFYHHWQHRMKPSKHWVNDYPAGPLTLWEFTEHPRTGLVQLIAFMNRLAAETAGRDDVLRVRYEDLREQPQEALEALICFVAGGVDPSAVRAAVEFGSFENMQRLERGNADDPRASGRLKPGDVNNPQSFKVRSGRVGGYREAYTPEQVASIDARVRSTLDPSFGYPLG